MRYAALSTAALLALGGCATGPSGGGGSMTFFITSVGPGKGGDLGGLEGADRHCQSLASAVGAGARTWRAYLSTQGAALNDPKVVHARDRIGNGPWHNVKGVLIARSVDDLHSADNNLTKETALDESGRIVNGRTENPNKHDVLTGSRPDGTAFAGAFFPDMTCGNWTRSGADGSAMTGHHDRAGAIDHPWATSWNSAHPTRGCTPEGIRSTGGDGLLYCFAAK
ncbi:MAG: hypothetical protein EPN19_01530 [Betaproteobacteria bacterium]|nr:MAG: hypothetical protein EPN19_01530 [Betaproteobacteria bacterium]